MEEKSLEAVLEREARRRARGFGARMGTRGRVRQRVALVLTAATTLGVIVLSYAVLKAEQMPIAALRLYLVIYGIMVFFLAKNFFKLMLGAWHTLRGPAGNPWHPVHSACDPRPSVRTAIVFPVFHEDVARVAAGIAATWASIEEKHAELADQTGRVSALRQSKAGILDRRAGGGASAGASLSHVAGSSIGVDR